MPLLLFAVCMLGKALCFPRNSHRAGLGFPPSPAPDEEMAFLWVYWAILCLCIVFLCQCDVSHRSEHETKLYDASSGQNLTIALSKAHIAKGSSDLLPGITIHGAIVLSDMALGRARNLSSMSSEQLQTLRKVSARIANYKLLQSLLPFTLTRWSGVIATQCPAFAGGQRTERGLIFAHYRIWREFLHFDAELLLRFNESQSTQPSNTSMSSKDHVYAIHPDGTRVKHGTVMRPQDVLVIFEDDAISAISDTNSTLLHELSRMQDIDILYLGWCEGRAARPVPLCAHAYAITRHAAEKLIHYLEPCGRAVDEQFVILAKNGWLRYRRAGSYPLRKDYDLTGDKTQGIFRQNKLALGSINGH